MNDKQQQVMRNHEELILENIARTERLLNDVAGASWIVRFNPPRGRMPTYLGGVDDDHSEGVWAPQQARQFLTESAARDTASRARNGARDEVEAVLYSQALAEAIDHHRRSLADFRDMMQEFSQ